VSPGCFGVPTVAFASSLAGMLGAVWLGYGRVRGSFTVYDNQTRSMLATPQRYPRAGSQSYPTPAAVANPDGSTTVYFGPTKPAGVSDGNWIQTDPAKGWSTIFRLYSPLQPFFTKTWQPSEIELVK